MAPSSSRSLRSGLPLRKAALATRAVVSGTGWIGAGLSDMAGLRRGGPATAYPLAGAQPTSPTGSGGFVDDSASPSRQSQWCFRRATARMAATMAAHTSQAPDDDAFCCLPTIGGGEPRVPATVPTGVGPCDSALGCVALI